MTGTKDWESLGREIKARRTELRLPQDLVDKGGPSEFTVRRLERGETDSIRAKTKTQLETVLQMKPGLIDRILDGTATEEDLAARVVRVGGVVEEDQAGVVRIHGFDQLLIDDRVVKVPGLQVTGLDSGVGSERGYVYKQPVGGSSTPTGSVQPEKVVANPTVVTVAELIARLGQQTERTSAAEDALQALYRLLPELWGEPYQES